MVQPEDRFRGRPDVTARDADDGLLVMKLATGEVWRLNQLGSAVWRMLDGATDVARIATALGREFDATTAAILNDVTKLLEDLASQELIERSG